MFWPCGLFSATYTKVLYAAHKGLCGRNILQSVCILCAFVISARIFDNRAFLLAGLSISKGTVELACCCSFLCAEVGHHVPSCAQKAAISAQCTFHTIVIFMWGSLHTRCYTHCVVQCLMADFHSCLNIKPNASLEWWIGFYTWIGYPLGILKLLQDCGILLWMIGDWNVPPSKAFSYIKSLYYPSSATNSHRGSCGPTTSSKTYNFLVTTAPLQLVRYLSC